MSTPAEGFVDVEITDAGFSLPSLKWRELLFIGALRQEGGLFVRDASRPMPPFAHGDVFPEGVAFRAEPDGDRIRLTRVGGRSGASGE